MSVFNLLLMIFGWCGLGWFECLVLVLLEVGFVVLFAYLIKIALCVGCK